MGDDIAKRGRPRICPFHDVEQDDAGQAPECPGPRSEPRRSSQAVTPLPGLPVALRCLRRSFATTHLRLPVLLPLSLPARGLVLGRSAATGLRTSPRTPKRFHSLGTGMASRQKKTFLPRPLD